MRFNLSKPCRECPFATDGRFVGLGREMKAEIANQLQVFPCHNTVDYSNVNEGEFVAKTEACAGFLLMHEHEGKPNQNMQIARFFGLYDPSKMDMTAPVFKSRAEFVEGL